jgi:O-antigen ligase
MAMAWLSPRVRRGIGIVPLGCLIVLLTALFGTISRGGFLSLVVGAAVVMLTAYRLRPTSILAVLALAVALGGGAAYTLNYLGVGEKVESRVTSSELSEGARTRQASWLHGLRLFADSPIWGVGAGVWATESVRPGMANPDPHNAYIRTLAFTGILGGILFAYMIYALYSVLLKSAKDLGEEFEFWRPYYVAALTALLAMNLFNSYFFDRYFFLVAGFAAALEQARRDAAIRDRAESRAACGELAANT